MFNRLSVKLSLLFVGIALVSVGVNALWVYNSVHTEFMCYCETHQATSSCEDLDEESLILMGETEQDFLVSIRKNLLLSAVIGVLLGLSLGLFFGRLIRGPMKQLALAARKIAAGDYSQRILTKTDDEIGEVSEAFNLMSEQLETKEKSRRQLLADIAHELRNPLSIIQGNMEAWLDGVISPTADQVASVYDETVLLSRLITDLRDLSLAEAGQLKLHQHTAEIGEIILSEIASVQARCRDKGISVVNSVPANLPVVFIDTDRVRQVLHNLIDNSLRYTPEGGTITIDADNDGNGWVRVSVSDNGTGIDSNDLPYVFDHFYKADRSRHRGYGGAGIGLAMVKQVVELHGGTVSVESDRGNGTTFSFTLPAVEN